MIESDRTFAGSIPELYERYFVPLIFEPYAIDIARRAQSLQPRRVLEIAAGTGVATRRLAGALPAASIIATDINEPMIRHAAAVSHAPSVEWRHADAMQLPFANGTFDLVVCQFGVMFFPDKAKAFSEARRVLRPGGHYLFSSWDRIEDNEIADVVTRALEKVFPQDPPRFMARIPHGYHDRDAFARDLAAGGFRAPAEIETVAERSRAESPRIPAVAYCEGSPLRNEIEARDASRLSEATDVATAAIAGRFGTTNVDAKIQAHVVMIER